MGIIKEEADVVRTAPNPLGAYIDARRRDNAAKKQHTSFFNSTQHADRVVQATEILVDFFGCNVSYITARGLNRNAPFENLKMADVGYKLSRMSQKFKWDQLYGPLHAMGDVDVISANGHLLVRVYPMGKMPRRRSIKSVYHWYDV